MAKKKKKTKQATNKTTKKRATKATGKEPKKGSAIERARVNDRLVKKLQGLLKDIPVDVIGHIDSTATCCRNGTVALVEIDEARINPSPRKKNK